MTEITVYTILDNFLWFIIVFTLMFILFGIYFVLTNPVTWR